MSSPAYNNRPSDTLAELALDLRWSFKHSAGKHRYRNAVFHLLISQTSCYRYWAQGLWVDYGLKICRRGERDPC